MSLREALPRFLRSRLYSHVSPNSVYHDALVRAGVSAGHGRVGLVNIPTQCAQGVLPSHFVLSWLHWSHARLILRRTGAPLLLPLLPALWSCALWFWLNASCSWGAGFRCESWSCCSAYCDPWARASNPDMGAWLWSWCVTMLALDMRPKP